MDIVQSQAQLRNLTLRASEFLSSLFSQPAPDADKDKDTDAAGGWRALPPSPSSTRTIWNDLLDWDLLCKKDIAVVTVWLAIFITILLAVLNMGFSATGVAAGSPAAWFQSVNYGGLTPAGGVFATLTSMAMLGTLGKWAAIFAGGVATVVVAIERWVQDWVGDFFG